LSSKNICIGGRLRENETFFGGIRKNKIVSSPLDKIKDGHEFQQIIAEYFRSLKNDDHEFNPKP